MEDATTIRSRDFDALWNTLAPTLTPDVELGETIRPPRPAETAERIDTLPTLAVELTGAPLPAGEKAYLRIHDQLGEGGLGLVHLATQVPLGRQVAVKSLKSPAREVHLSLLREARITGLLEHPNIVPVYTLGQDGKGLPILVMKRVEGQSWDELLRAERDDGGRLPAGALARHLDVLMRVADAVHFAHDRGVIHRDLKPANVMLGPFGEVYLLDWGIAVCRSGLAAELQLGGAQRGLAGTPSYLAPEQLEGDPSIVDARTDVYLLGAILHELVTGTRRHRGETLHQVLASAFYSEPPEYDARVPRELAEACRVACAREPGERYPTVAAFRAAIADYLEHRHAAGLASEARAPLASLRAGLASGADDRALQEAFGEARFGFRQSLRIWPENATPATA